MSIHIKEYLSLLAMIGIIKTFSANKKLDDAIRIISFFAMMTMIVFPLTASIISGDFLKNVRDYDYQTESSNRYMSYFAQSMADDAAGAEIKEIEEGFKREFILRGIKVLKCTAQYDGIFSVELETDRQIDTGIIERLKVKYGVDKVSIRLVNTYD